MDMSFSKLREIVKNREVCGIHAVFGVTKSQIQLSHWKQQWKDASKRSKYKV